MHKSLLASGHSLAQPENQLRFFAEDERFPRFTERLQAATEWPLKPQQLQVFQVNLGKMCNQVCAHCHVDAGPDRKEIMTWETMELCIQAIKNTPSISTVDLTGGAPEMNPHFRPFVEALSQLRKQIIVRCNLTIILANKKYNDLPDFYKQHNCQVVSSLPFYAESRTDKQRGDGVFKKSIEALKLLNKVGYGMEGSGLELHLVYNPAGAFLPPPQEQLKADYKAILQQEYGISFNDLFAITNIPISRYLNYLVKSENYEAYMTKLVNAYNPATLQGLMCRNTISVGWDGYLYDCDFNQMLDLKTASTVQHLSTFDLQALNHRAIQVNQHCFGCTAGSGSSCGGEIA
ncbi:MAG: arsenosugar biosynthesis radical SAM protein ArsS [Saprospiraceae bacterium]|nr:arsenosugar biosynthesis radical SAM protein ArsS [Saprospiraceae bacterium]